jgi:hypothetical protein
MAMACMMHSLRQPTENGETSLRNATKGGRLFSKWRGIKKIDEHEILYRRRRVYRERTITRDGTRMGHGDFVY